MPYNILSLSVKIAAKKRKVKLFERNATETLRFKYSLVSNDSYPDIQTHKIFNYYRNIYKKSFKF